MKLSGVRGAIIVGARVAARLGKWKTEKPSTPGEFEVEAKVEDTDEYLMRLSPKYLELEIGKVRKRWTVTNLAVVKTKALITVDGATNHG